MTQVFQRAPGDKPATHAFVLGCGRFPKLGPAAARQAAVAGARAIVRYLLEQQDELVAPLASVECLLSDPDVRPGLDSLGVGKFPGDPRRNDGVDAVLKANVEAAGEAWLNRCHPGDHMFFYMSSHGVADRYFAASGLFEDVLVNKFKKWGASLNINILAANLPVTEAGACWVFLDACQELVPSILGQNNGTSGVVLVEAAPNDMANLKVRSLGLAGSRFGQPAWAPDGPQPPYFTQALMRSFKACVDRRPGGDWVVTGEKLMFHIPDVANAACGYAALEVESLSTFAVKAELVKVPDPKVPVVVRTNNLADMAQLLHITAEDGENAPIVAAPQQTNCFFEVPANGHQYHATARFNGTFSYQPAQFSALPCAQIVELTP